MRQIRLCLVVLTVAGLGLGLGETNAATLSKEEEEKLAIMQKMEEKSETAVSVTPAQEAKPETKSDAAVLTPEKENVKILSQEDVCKIDMTVALGIDKSKYDDFGCSTDVLKYIDAYVPIVKAELCDEESVHHIGSGGGGGGLRGLKTRGKTANFDDPCAMCRYFREQDGGSIWCELFPWCDRRLEQGEGEGEGESGIDEQQRMVSQADKLSPGEDPAYRDCRPAHMEVLRRSMTKMALNDKDVASAKCLFFAECRVKFNR